MGGMPNQGMMNLTPMQQQQFMQQQQQQQHQQTAANVQQQILHQQQQQPVGGMQQQPQQQIPQQGVTAAGPGLPNTAADPQKHDPVSKVKNLLYPLKERLAVINH